MDIFTYCSYRSSRYGYQYATFSSKSNGTISSIISSEMKKNIILNEFVDWCENKSNWQLVLKRIANTKKYLIMVGKLEESRELKKILEYKKGNDDNFDSDYYMTLGFYGNISEIKPLAFYLLNEYTDGFRSLFDRLESTISKSCDAARYEIDSTKFNKIFNNIQIPPIPVLSNQKKSIFNCLIHKLKTDPCVRLSVKSAQENSENLKIRKQKVKESSKLLFKMEDFSENILILVACDFFTINEKINIHIDYEYLWYFDKGGVI